MNFFGIFLSDRELWLLGAAGACCTLLISHRLSLWREKKARYIAAASSLRASFAAHLSSLRVGSGRTAGHLLAALIKDFPMHATEMKKFKPFVFYKNRAAYEKACQEYAEIVTTRRDEIDKAPDQHLFLKEHINAILIYAERLGR
jgi:hypothetical protein